VIVAPGFESALTDACSGAGPAVIFLADPGGASARRFNALWQPRAAAIDERGRLCYLQPDTTPDTAAPGELAALWMPSE